MDAKISPGGPILAGDQNFRDRPIIASVIFLFMVFTSWTLEGNAQECLAYHMHVHGELSFPSTPPTAHSHCMVMHEVMHMYIQ